MWLKAANILTIWSVVRWCSLTLVYGCASFIIFLLLLVTCTSFSIIYASVLLFFWLKHFFWNAFFLVNLFHGCYITAVKIADSIGFILYFSVIIIELNILRFVWPFKAYVGKKLVGWWQALVYNRSWYAGSLVCASWPWWKSLFKLYHIFLFVLCLKKNKLAVPLFILLSLLIYYLIKMVLALSLISVCSESTTASTLVA